MKKINPMVARASASKRVYDDNDVINTMVSIGCVAEASALSTALEAISELQLTKKAQVSKDTEIDSEAELDDDIEDILEDDSESEDADAEDADAEDGYDEAEDGEIDTDDQDLEEVVSLDQGIKYSEADIKKLRRIARACLDENKHVVSAKALLRAIKVYEGSN